MASVSGLPKTKYNGASDTSGTRTRTANTRQNSVYVRFGVLRLTMLSLRSAGKSNASHFSSEGSKSQREVSGIKRPSYESSCALTLLRFVTRSIPQEEENATYLICRVDIRIHSEFPKRLKPQTAPASKPDKTIKTRSRQRGHIG